MTMCALSVQSNTELYGVRVLTLECPTLPGPQMFHHHHFQMKMEGKRWGERRHGCSETVLEELPLLSFIPIG